MEFPHNGNLYFKHEVLERTESYSTMMQSCYRVYLIQAAQTRLYDYRIQVGDVKWAMQLRLRHFRRPKRGIRIMASVHSVTCRYGQRQIGVTRGLGCQSLLSEIP